MENEIVSAGRFASVEIVSRHLTSLGTYAVKKELMLPVPNSTDQRKVIARDALTMFRQQHDGVDEFWHVPFLAPLESKQRMYFVSLDMFEWPHKIIARTPNCVVLPTPGSTSCMDVLIHTHTVPKFLWLELVYAKNTSNPQTPIVLNDAVYPNLYKVKQEDEDEEEDEEVDEDEEEDEEEDEDEEDEDDEVDEVDEVDE